MRTAAVVGVVAAALIGAAPAAADTSIHLAPCAEASVARPDQARLLARMVNAERAWHGLPPLTLKRALSVLAQSRSLSMAAAGTMSHAMRGGRLAWAPAGRLAGENLALAPDAPMAMSAMLSSAAHRRIMLSATYRSLGVGAVGTCSGTVFTLSMLQ